MKMNGIQFCNCFPKLVDCSQEEQYGVETQHVLPKIVDLQKCPILTHVWCIQVLEQFLVIQNLGQYMLGLHTVLLLLATLD